MAPQAVESQQAVERPQAVEVAETIAALDARAFDPAMRAKAKACLLDFLGCAFEATALDPSRQAMAAVFEAPGGHIIGETATATPADAAFVNAVKGHGLVREDMHAASVSHHGVVVWPLLLALAETRRIAGSRLLEAAILAYLSDMTLLDTSLHPHGRSIFDRDLQVASLDHAMWFHRPFKLDDWLLYTQDTPSASGARGFNRGAFYTRDGILVASVAQEGLIRVHEAEK